LYAKEKGERKKTRVPLYAVKSAKKEKK